ncbi:Gpr1 family protein [Auriculariales sp. MPI-PUGE-AT-0066]|nr:Gpr1 family protein [Auriculariales sp. MPI-PUGE-AT-0066]
MYQQPRPRTIGNPTPLGLYSFACTTLLISLFNVQVRGITNGNLIIGMGLACGGLSQLLAGMWSFVRSDSLGGTAFSMYGAFWISYGLMHIPGLNIVTSYTGDSADQLHNAEGLFLAMWFVVTFFTAGGALRQPVMLFATLFFLDITFMMLMIGAFMNSAGAVKAGGYVGIVTCICAFYEGTAVLYTEDVTPIRLPNPMMPQFGRRQRKTDTEASPEDMQAVVE